jgi:hypothetical protein
VRRTMAQRLRAKLAEIKGAGIKPSPSREPGFSRCCGAITGTMACR